LPEENCAKLMRNFVVENKAHLSFWEPLQADDYYTENYWKKKIEEIRGDFLSDKSCCLNIYEKETSELIGMINFNNFIRGAFHSCFLGFKISQQAQGRGLMTEALQAALQYLFQKLNLHRVSANYMPNNQASARVLGKCGFKKEGIAEDYLCIAGKWERHVLTGLVNSSWRGNTSSES
jgi:ribosomal-protein-alanine N-acetyltransferase